MTTPISDVISSNKFAQDWAMQNKQDIIQAVQFSTKWFEATEQNYKNQETLKINLEIFTREKNKESEYWKKCADESWQKNSAWTLETVKHLAIINGAGLAGCSAMLAKATSEKPLIYAFFLFAIGLLLAVADMYFVSIGYWKRAEKYSDIHLKIKKSTFHDEIYAPIKTNNFKIEWQFTFSSILGWTSAIMAVLAGIFFTVNLVK